MSTSIHRSSYQVEGMTCDHCVRAVSQEVLGLADVTDVEVDLERGRVDVFSTQPLDPSAVAAAVEEAGYELVT